MTVARLLDVLTVAAGLGLASALALWWARPEILFLVLLGVASARLVVAPIAVPVVRPRRIVAGGVVLYAALFSLLTVARHANFRTHALDLGYYVQLTWSLATGRGAWVSLPEMHAWGDHLSPIMYMFVPLFWLWPGPVVLLVAQSVALALGAIPVFAIARRRLGDERPAAALAVLYLLNPSLHGINVRDFHAAALAIPLLLVALWAVEAGRPVAFALAGAMTLACREDAALPLFGIGMWLVLSRRRWLWGTATAVVALAALLVDVRWVIPWFRGEPYPHLGRYARFGATLGEIASSLLLQPLRAAATLASADRLTYLLALLAPLALLPLLAWPDLVGALPALAQNLLASDPVLYGHRTQYQAFVLPFLILAAIGGYARLARGADARRARIAVAAAMVASLALTARTVNDLAATRWWPGPEARAAHAVLAQVPADAAVSAQDPYVPHLSLRRRVAVFPADVDGADHVVLDAATYPWRRLPGVTMTREGDRVTITTPDGGPRRYTVAAEAGRHLLLKRLVP